MFKLRVEIMWLLMFLISLLLRKVNLYVEEVLMLLVLVVFVNLEGVSLFLVSVIMLLYFWLFKKLLYEKSWMLLGLVSGLVFFMWVIVFFVSFL